MTAASTSPTPRTATTSSTCRWPIRAGLSNPGGFSVVEKYSYTREAMSAYMRALKPGGILSVTLWNKEEPPKSVLKLYATMVAAARDVDGPTSRGISTSPRPTSRPRPCSTRTAASPPEEIAELNAHTKAMSFDDDLLSRPQGRHRGAAADPPGLSRPVLLRGRAGRRDGAVGEGARRQAAAGHGHAAPTARPKAKDDAPPAPRISGHRARPPGLALPDQRRLAEGGGRVRVRDPYPHQPPAVLRRLHQGEGPAEIHRPARAGAGRVGLPATVGDARHRRRLRLTLVLLPADLRLATIFSRYPGKFGTMLYFLCLGLGYIIVEVGMIAALHPGALQRHGVGVGADHRHAGVLGLRQLRSERYLDRARTVMPKIFLAIFPILALYAFTIDYSVLDSDRHAARAPAHRALHAAAVSARLPHGLPPCRPR